MLVHYPPAQGYQSSEMLVCFRGELRELPGYCEGFLEVSLDDVAVYLSSSLFVATLILYIWSFGAAAVGFYVCL